MKELHLEYIKIITHIIDTYEEYIDEMEDKYELLSVSLHYLATTTCKDERDEEIERLSPRIRTMRRKLLNLKFDLRDKMNEEFSKLNELKEKL